jgi:RimJ/RimL family protein N-acetyltransferase
VTTIRPVSKGDANALLALQHALDTESEFMLLEPGEREPRELPGAPSSLIVAEGNDELAGYVEVSVLPYARAASTGYVVMGVRTAYAGQGIGKALLTAARDEAVERGLRRLELTVMTHNTRALNLYLNCGFEVEGLRRDALTVGGVIRSEYYMGLLLAERHPRP